MACFLNNYDDTAAKKKAKDRTLPSMGPGWLGRLGVVYVKGANLFDTLMRNLMFCGTVESSGERMLPVGSWMQPGRRNAQKYPARITLLN